ncbi:MAG: hypothetical protein D6B28_11450 [Gammaproteobacteria bacterium]|nr:MAG: hypothetical protein D6B28_11450 [Gammaproteobacteria bacterium]
MRQRIGVWLASLLIALPILSISPGAMALGLGKMELKSALNQPLDGVIPLLSVREKDLEHLKVKLAAAPDFKRAGIERPYFLSKINFEIIQKKDKKYIVKLTTKDSIQEPFLNFLVEVRWANGRMLREFTVLLDPPVTASTYQKPGTPKAAAKPAPVKKVTKQPTKPKKKTASKGVAVSKRPKISTESRRGAAKPSGRGAASGTYKVRRGQTLWKIARDVRDRDTQSVEQMMMALYKNNPDAFSKNNMNSLLAGRVLNLPDNEQVQDMTTAQAKRAIREQTRAWRKGLSSPSTSKTATQTKKEKQAGTAAPAKAKPKSVGRIEVVAPSKDTVSGDKSIQTSGKADAKDSQEITRLRSELAAAQKAMEEQKNQNDDLQSNVKELEGKIKSMERLLALKDQEMAKLQSKISGQPVQEQAEIIPEEVEVKVEEGKPEEVAPEVATTPIEKPAEETVAEQQPEEQPAEQVPAQPKRPEPKVPEMPKDVKAEAKSTLMDDPKIWAIASGAILAILILIWIIVRSMFRRGDYSEAELEESGVSTVITSVEGDEDEHEAEEIVQMQEQAAEPVAQEPETEEQQPSEDEEPSIIREADVYVAYGRASQAIEKLQKASEDHPDNLKIRHKLLEVLSQTGDTELFDKEAKAYFELINDPSDEEWLEIVEIGQKLSPDSPLYKEADSILGGEELSIDELLEDEEDLGGDELEMDLEEDLLAEEEVGLSVGETFEEEEPVSLEAEEGTDITAEMQEGEELEKVESDEFDMSLDFEKPEFEEDAVAEAKAEEQEDEQKLAYEPAESDIDELADLEFELDTLDADVEVENDAGEKIDSGTVDLEGGMEEPAFIEDTFTEQDLSEEISEADIMDLDETDIGGDLDEDLAELDEMGDFSDLEIGDDDLGLDDLDEDDDLIIDDSDEVSTKLDLAKAYIDMGDTDGAKSILSEVVADGNDEQKTEAQELIDQL